MLLGSGCGVIHVRAFHARLQPTQVQYIGKNTSGTACGTPTLMRYLSGRASIHHITQIANVLIHYGPGLRPFPYVYHEEYAATHQDNGIILYDAQTERYTENEWDAKVHRA